MFGSIIKLKKRESQEGGGDLTLSGGGKMFFPNST
jgi:hypothetical protein